MISLGTFSSHETFPTSKISILHLLNYQAKRFPEITNMTYCGNIVPLGLIHNKEGELITLVPQ